MFLCFSILSPSLSLSTSLIFVKCFCPTDYFRYNVSQKHDTYMSISFRVYLYLVIELQNKYSKEAYNQIGAFQFESTEKSLLGTMLDERTL